MYYFYVLQNQDDALYFGSTNNLKRRLSEHQEGSTRTTKKDTWRLIYYEAYLAEVDARTREERIKYHGQAAAQLKRRIQLSRQAKS